jgi:sulfur-carrier protein
MTPFETNEGATPRADQGEGDGPESAVAGSATVTLLLFASAREAAGTGREEISAPNVKAALDDARMRHGEPFSAVLERSRIWLNGEPVDLGHPLRDGDELAVLPPVSGG